VHDRITAWEQVAARSTPHRDLAAKHIEELRGHEVEIEQKLRSPTLGEPDAEEISRVKAQWRDVVLAQGEVTKNYLAHFVQRIDVVERKVTIVQRLPQAG
jgi:hypothetical protein